MKRWAVLLAAMVACSKGKTPVAALPPSSESSAAIADGTVPTAGDDSGDSMDPREAAQWAAAKEDDPEERMRLADLVGCAGLRERGEQPELRATAIAAMRYCGDFSELPWLAQIGGEGSDDDARAALDAITDLAARPRRSTDPEDADELHTGCASLLALARSQDRPRQRRVPAIRALRMLAEYGCVKRADIPTDLDVAP